MQFPRLALQLFQAFNRVLNPVIWSCVVVACRSTKCNRQLSSHCGGLLTRAMDEEQQPFTPQDGPSSGKQSQPTTQLCETSQAEEPSEMAEEQSEGAPAWLSGILHDLLHTEVKTALETVLLPRTRAIEQDISTMQSQAQDISAKSKEEHAEVANETAKMAQRVYNFQSQFSHALGEGWEAAIPGN